MERKLIPIGRCLRDLQNRIAEGYPEGTTAEISDITVVIREKGKASRVVQLIPRYEKQEKADRAPEKRTGET